MSFGIDGGNMGKCKKRIIDLHRFEYENDGSILYEGDSFPSKTFSGRGKIDGIDVFLH